MNPLLEETQAGTQDHRASSGKVIQWYMDLLGREIPALFRFEPLRHTSCARTRVEIDAVPVNFPRRNR